MASYFRTNLAGDLTGALPQPVVAKIQTIPVSSTAPTTNAVFNYNGSSWIPTITPTITNVIDGYTTTVTAAGTTILTNASTQQQFFTGTSAQTVRLPQTSTLVLGQSYCIVNNSTGLVTVQTFTSAAVTAVLSSSSLYFTVINLASDVAASWNFTTSATTSVTGLTANSFLYGNSSGVLMATASATNGQLLIGSTGAAPVAATLTSGTGISVTNGAGSITIANTGVTSLSAGTTGLSVSASVGAITLSGTLVVSNGGTGQTTFGVGSLLLGNGTTALASLADVAVGSALTSGGVGVNPAWTAFTSNATVSTLMSRDANGNTRIGNLIEGYTTTATAAGTTTLTVASTFLQFFTGATTQTVRLPVTTTLVNGQQYQIVNTSTGALTIQTGGAAAITTVPANTSYLFTCINNGSDVAASWNFTLPAVGTTGTSLTLTGLTANSFLYSGTGGLLTTTAAPTNGQLLIGSTGAAPVAASLTSGTGITITSGAGSITVTNSGVTSLSTGTTGLTVSASTGAVTLGGTLVVSNGGTGQTTFGVGSLLLGNGTTALASLADVAVGSALTSGGVGVNPGWTAFTSNATASTLMSRDANINTRVNNLIEAYTTTATAAGITLLLVSSSKIQFYTGTATQSVRLPVTTTLVNGQQYEIVNLSTTFITIQTTTANAFIVNMPSNTRYLFTCIDSTSDVPASWNFTLPPVGTTGTSLTLTGLTANSFLYSGTGGLLTTTAAPTNGQLLIGSTGAAPVAAALTAGTGISITNGAGSISIANTGVTSLTTGTTGLSVSASTGAITLSGTLVVSNGGTGQTTFGVGSILLGNGTTALGSLAGVATGSALTSGGVGVNPGWTAFTNNATVSTLMSRDANANTRVNNLIEGYTTTATAAGTTTLTVASTWMQYFTGATTQTVRLPVTTTLVNGQQYQIVNTSSGTLTIQTGGAAAVTTIAASTYILFTCIDNTTDIAASWNFTAPASGGGSLSGDVTGTLSTTNVVSIDSLPINATTGASSSIFFGYSSTVPTTTASIGIGYQALNVATSSTARNVAVGVQALATLSLGLMGDGNNIALGFQAMNRANADQTALGQGSSNNVAIGTFALNAPVLNSSNVMIGSGASSFTSLNSCVAVGRFALCHFTSLYSTGTASQSGTTITGVGTTFTPSMVGNYILYSGGQAATINGYTSPTVLSASSSQTVGSSTFQIYSGSTESVGVGLNALQLCNSNRNTAVGSSAGANINKSTYSTGTAGTGGVSSTTVTGVGTEWTSVMVGGLILFTGGAQGTITAIASTTSLTVSPAITVANGTAYVIYLSNGGNTLLGATTGTTLSTGNGNLLIGYSADCGADSINAIVIGVNARAGVAAATDTIMIGRSAGNVTATGDGNIGMGLRAFQAATSINRSVAIGTEALLTATSGNGAIAIGYQALRLYNGGTRNLAIGLQAGTALTSGSANIIMGYQAGSFMSTGGANILIGDFAGLNGQFANSSGFNTLIGYQAGLFMGDGLRNNGVGQNAIYGVGVTTTGSQNQAFGGHTLTALTSGTDNVAIGQSALVGLTTGTGNIGIGQAALGSLINTGGANANSGNYNVTGSSNIAIGNQCASYFLTGSAIITLSGSNNTLMGASAARYITASASTNVAIGSNAYSTVGGSSSSVVIGSNAVVGTFGANTIGQSGTTVTASSAVFLPEMVGGTVVYRALAGTGSTGISAYVSSTVVTATTSVTVTSQQSEVFYNTTGTTAVGTGALNAAITGRNTAVGFNALTVATGGRYAVGTASQATTTITGVGTAWFAEMVGGTIVFTGGATSLITGFTNATTLTAATSQTVGSTTYIIYLPYNGNVGVGYSVGSGVTNGHYNTLMGYGAGSSITTGFNNVCVGFGANTSATVANSISIGRSASATVDGAVAIGTVTANQAGGFFCQHRGPISVTFNAAGFIAGTNELVELTSSRRYKTNIRDLESVSDKFDRLRPVRFNPIEGYGDVNSEHIGLIAEEVEELWPEFIAHDKEGLTTGMAYDRMISVLIKEMQAMKAEIKALKASRI